MDIYLHNVSKLKLIEEKVEGVAKFAISTLKFTLDTGEEVNIRFSTGGFTTKHQNLELIVK